jgi:hypothetical protein
LFAADGCAYESLGSSRARHDISSHATETLNDVEADDIIL